MLKGATSGAQGRVFPLIATIASSVFYPSISWQSAMRQIQETFGSHMCNPVFVTDISVLRI